MRALGWVVALLVALGVASCGSHKDKVMPNVTGEKLDAAKSDIKNAGFDDKVKVVGGGLFGVVADSNWVVCAQTPVAGQSLTGTPQLKVDRSCDNGAAASASPSDSSPGSEATIVQPSPTRAAAHATITAENNQDFAALLADPNGDCDNSTESFAKKYWDGTIEFDGKIASISSHNGDTYVQDVLVYDGKAAVAFQFNGVTIQPGGHAPAALGLPANSQSLAEGNEVHIVAKVDHFNQTQCVFRLTPVSAKIIS
jgi:Domain of unknown function (DUF4839)